VAMLNLDMVGRLREGRLSGGGVGTSPEFRQIIEAANGGRLTLRLNEDGFGPSDHASFYAKQIPVLFFFTGSHEDYHKPSDTAEKINYEGQAQVVAFVADIVRALDRQTARPAYAATRGEAGGRSTGFRVYLGTVPSYAESNDGLALDAVRDDSPAKKAGLQAGDKIVRLAGREIKNVYDYTYALGEMQPDREYEVEVVRGGKRLKLKIAPQARR
jgi:aminopeptidase YwaD